MQILAISPGEGFEPALWRTVLSSGIDALMIREKQMEARALLDLTRWVQAQAPTLKVWVNGRLDVALATGCGLHAPESYPEIPQGLLPLSRPLHDPRAFQDRAQADQLLLSPVFASPGKGPVLEGEGLHRWLEMLPAYAGSLLALGGITPENAGALRHPRLTGVALIRALWNAPDPGRIVEKLRVAWAG